MGSNKQAMDVIPIIDLSPWLLEDGSEEAKTNVVQELHDACVTYGFFQLVGHGISLELQTKVLHCAAEFFDLPMEEKMEVSTKKSMGHANRGYEVLSGQTLETGALPDLKEGFFIGAEVSADNPRAGRFLTGPNQWPKCISTKNFEHPLQTYRGRMVQLAELVLKLLAFALPTPATPSFFDEFMNEPSGNLRLLHYPPKPSAENQQPGCGAHTDFGGITFVLQQPGTKGLEVFYPPREVWIPVPAKENAFVANIGDLVHIWTGKYYRSATHRVSDVGSDHRYSAPFFFNGDMDFRIHPLDGGPSMTVEQHIRGKLMASHPQKAAGKFRSTLHDADFGQNLL